MNPMPTDPIHSPGDVPSTPAVGHSTQRKQGRKNPLPQKRKRRRGKTPPDAPDAEALKKLVTTEDDDTEHVDFLA